MPEKLDSFLVEILRYHNWANAQLLSILQNLPDSQLEASAPGAYGTIRDTLRHMLAAQADYIGRITGDIPWPDTFGRDDTPTAADLAAWDAKLAPILLDVVQRTPQDHIVHEEEDGNTIDYQARLLFMQAVQHGVEHRTNVTTILAAQGVELPELDTWGYLFAYPERFSLKESSR